MGTAAVDISHHLERAAAARRSADLASEIIALDAALAKVPDDPMILNARGMAALRSNDFAGALAAFERAVEADRNEITLLINLATAARGKNDIDRERAALEAALAMDRLHFIAQLRRAELATRSGERGVAYQSWSAVVQIAHQMDDPPPLVVNALRRGQAYLTQHNALIAAHIDKGMISVFDAMGSAARRVRGAIDYSLGRRAIFSNQCAGVHVPFLPADEFFDRALFPWFETLEAKTDLIRQEALTLIQSNYEAIRPYVQMEAGSPETKWSALDRSLDWSACFLWEYGARNDAVCAMCPETAAALDLAPQNHVPGKAPSAFFSVLRPGAHIPPHTGVTNSRAIIHLPLVVPDGCRFRVGGEIREWRVGEAFAFDDTIEHEAWNDSKDVRIVLIFDVWNPHLTVDEQSALTHFFALSNHS